MSFLRGMQEVREDVPAIDHMILDLERKHDYVEDFARDFYNLAAKGDPQVRTTASMRRPGSVS